jgi:hypothetical protein
MAPNNTSTKRKAQKQTGARTAQRSSNTTATRRGGGEGNTMEQRPPFATLRRWAKEAGYTLTKIEDGPMTKRGQHAQAA